MQSILCHHLYTILAELPKCKIHELTLCFGCVELEGDRSRPNPSHP